MPLLSTIIWLLVNMCMALGLNWIAKELGLISNSEIIALYFIIAAARLQDAQSKFSIAYSQDPDLVEYLLREQLKKETGGQ